ncbi:hypothetical protein VPHF99_0030 [Vibrio phage F99]
MFYYPLTTIISQSRYCLGILHTKEVYTLNYLLTSIVCEVMMFAT